MVKSSKETNKKALVLSFITYLYLDKGLVNTLGVKIIKSIITYKKEPNKRQYSVAFPHNNFIPYCGAVTSSVSLKWI